MQEHDKQRLRRDVAEKVMGWELHHPVIERPNVIMWRKPGEQYPGRDESEIPHYENDIAAAWQVLERVTAIENALINPKTTFPAGTHIAYTWDNVSLWSYSASEAAEKICLMCYEAVTGQEWE